MILRGEVIKEERMYVLVDRDSEIMHLKSLVEEKEKEIKNLKEKGGNSEELYEAKVQWEYYQKLYEEEVKDKQNRIRKCFQWIKAKYPKAEWDEFRDWVM